ncbi:MAG TPA: glycoside hydrolase family 3 C-terminal domain-containing protein [Streptosporangiaceae bacterium]|nr:glycoside hydrolase family 3 C-terminal domain-containing protein [Streptosporangiaceae bacterium]
MTTRYEGLTPPGRVSGRAGAPVPATQAGLLSRLSVQDKVLLLTGADAWRTQGAEALGLRPMITSDGPAGVRGVVLDERHPSSSLPCPSALGATWDPGLVGELAATLGAEARAKGVDVLLAPTINLMRTPLGGRGFECFSEDPVLTGRLGVAFVRGVQSAGVAATVKHFVGNDSETERWTYDARISERVLRELYLAPFEACVREAGVALVMAAYNKVNGIPMTEHARLLRDVLKDEWGFDGVVTSDWHAARSTAATALAALDLAMPGPDGPWGGQLAQAVADGAVTGEVLDDKVIRLLRLAARVNALCLPGGDDPPGPPRVPAARADLRPAVAPGAADAASPRPDSSTDPDRSLRPGASLYPDSSLYPRQSLHPGQPLPPDPSLHPSPLPHPDQAFVDPALLRRAVAASLVLLRNEGGALPIDPGSVGRVAVIGPNAIRPAIHGGGSAVVMPVTVSTPADAIAEALAGQAEVTVSGGCQTWVVVPEPAPGSLRDPGSGRPGLRLEFRDCDGELLAAEHRTSPALTWWDQVPPGIGWGKPGTVVLLTSFRPEVGGPHVFGVAGVGRLTLTVDGAVVADAETVVPDDPVEAMARPGELRATVELEAGRQAQVRLEFRPAADGEGPLTVRLGIVPVAADDDLLAEAERAAGLADAAIVVVGTAPMTESEGFDRSTLALPGRQDELVRRVAAANRRTVVVINAGMPVLMPWADQVAAVIYAWLPGQAMGTALADVLLGRAEPGGRLPVTLPAAEADCPVLHAIPEHGVIEYSEGLLIGYRGYDASLRRPHFPFGHGLGYTSWVYESALATAADPAAGDDLEVTVTVRNSGSRPGREVIQAYLAGPPSDPAAPPRQLAAFAGVSAAAGARAEATLRLPARAFARWDEREGGWTWPPGPFTVHVGRSSRDLRLSLQIGSGTPGGS